MSDSNSSDFHTVLGTLEQRLELFHSALERKLDDLIHKEEVNQLWKLAVESTIHSIWAKVCVPRLSVSVSCQTEEPLEQYYNKSTESSSRLHENRPVIQEQEDCFVFCAEEDSQSNSKDHADMELISVDSSAAHENESSTSMSDAHQDSESPNQFKSKKVKLFSCPLCEAKFSRKDELLSHERTHAEIKCKICSRVYTNIRDFELHSRSHTGNFPFECSKCGKSFSSKGHLRSHSVYHKEPKHRCIACEKTFRTPAQLNAHMVTHTGEKRFACNVCQKGFSRREYLISHARVHLTE